MTGLPLLTTLLLAAAQPAADETLRVRVEVAGVRGAVRQNVRAHLGLAREQTQRRELTETQARMLHAHAPAEIRAALEPFGYYRARIVSALHRDRRRWVASYQIEPGPAVRITDIDIDVAGAGAHDDAVVQAVTAFPLRVGDPLRHEAYERGKRALQAAALERGYLDAAFGVRRVEVDPAQGSATILLRFETGDRYRFGPVTFDGADLSPELLQGFVPFAPGSYVSHAALRELEGVLRGSGLFHGVEVELSRERGDAAEVPVQVRLSERMRTAYNFGLGYGTDTGPRATIGGEWRRLNERGHHAGADMRASFIRNGVSGRYAIPIAGTGGDHIAFSAGVLDERTRGAQATTAVLGAALYQARGGWRESLYIKLHREWYEAGDGSGRTTLVLPGGAWSRARSDNPTYPMQGYRVRLDIAGTHTALGSGVSFAQAAVRTRGIYSFWSSGRFLVRGETGATAVNATPELPVSFRFFAGGDRSVRGYGHRALGPVGEDGRITGARHFLVGSVEYEHRISEQWGAAIFFDAGNAADRWPIGARSAVGVGARWRSPVGPVRVDVASALSEAGTPWRLHLTVGPDL